VEFSSFHLYKDDDAEASLSRRVSVLFLFLHPLSVAAPVPCACRLCCRSASSLTVLRGESDLEVTKRKASVQCRNPTPSFLFICFAAVGFFRRVYLKIKCYPRKIRRVPHISFFFFFSFLCCIIVTFILWTHYKRAKVFSFLCAVSCVPTPF
ncbi:unnamed protein product, partial [Ixodes pacificus]